MPFRLFQLPDRLQKHFRVLGILVIIGIIIYMLSGDLVWSARGQQELPPLPVAIEIYSQLTGNDTSWTAHAVLQEEFTLRHYLVIQNILRHVRPYVFYLYVSHLTMSIPVEFEKRMNEEYPNVELVRHSALSSISFSDILRLLASSKGGVYFSLDVLLQPPFGDLLRQNQCLVDTRLRIVSVQPSCPYFTNPSALEAYQRPLVSDHPDDTRSVAILLSKDTFDRLNPFHSVDPLTNDDRVWNSLIWRAHCSCDQLEPVRHAEAVIPNTVHYIWFSSNTWNMTFMQLISVLSNLKINRVIRVFIHSNTDPTGPHWDWLKHRYGDKIARRYYPQPKYIHGKEIKSTWIQHSCDIARLTVLQRHGGMYFDWDAIVLKSHEELRYYDGVMGLDRPWSFGLSNGHIMFSAKSEFLRLYKSNYVNYDRLSWGKTSIYAPREIYQKHPYLLKVPSHFMKCEADDTLLDTSRSRANLTALTPYFAFHFSSEPEELFKFELNFTSVARLDNLFGDVVRHVMDYPG